MSKYLDFDNPKWQKGYKLFSLTDKNIKDNIGKKICYLLKRDYDSARGYMHVRYGVVHSIKYNRVIIDNGDSDFDRRDVLEAGIKID